MKMSLSKQEEFLWSVQAYITLDSANITLDLPVSEREKISVSGRLETVVFAVRASRAIPDNMSAEKAAWDFIMWIIQMNNNPSAAHPPIWFRSQDLGIDFTA